MDDLQVNGKIMESAMNENMYDEASDTGVSINYLKNKERTLF